MYVCVERMVFEFGRVEIEGFSCAERQYRWDRGIYNGITGLKRTGVTKTHFSLPLRFFISLSSVGKACGFSTGATGSSWRTVRFL